MTNMLMCKLCFKRPVVVKGSIFTQKLLYCSKECRSKDNAVNSLVIGISQLIFVVTYIIRENIVMVLLFSIITVILFGKAYKSYKIDIDN